MTRFSERSSPGGERVARSSGGVGPPEPCFASTNFPLAWLVRVNPRDAAALSGIIQTVVDKSGQPLYRMQRDDQLDALGPVLDQQEVTGRAVALIALLVGGLGILGVGVASVRERSREFGVRRALGASRIRIFVGVVVQSLLEVLLAALIAVPLAAILLELYARDLVLDTLPLPSNITLPLGSVGAGVGSALLVGLIASLLPATTAARANVIQVLRG
ncbi:MAG: FtsX-like permease family protein [Chloroflexia bacterium]|nr:FtsX-like permease family protein [Chloroflexia bacterium]